MTKHLAKEARKETILDAAVDEALACGWQWITRDAIARRAGISLGCVNYHYRTMIQLKRAVMRAAVDRRILPLIAQGLTDRNEHALGAADDLKAAALESVKA
jgi:AcrR family transcriptional regulator